MLVWGYISMQWCKSDMRREREEWEADKGSLNLDNKSGEPVP